MNYWLKLLLLSTFLGFVKAQHFIKLVVLAGLGLAGLWMVHTLAQDFNVIQNNSNNNDGERGLFKRSIPDKDKVIDWEMVLSRDPASCARSFLCQLVATKEQLLSNEEKLMLNLVRHSSKGDTWASKQLQEALKNGEKITRPSQCMKIYKYCPFTSQMMMTLLRMFGR
ncbi:uncharacterized protein [Leptinotarsa decemlineata]|uniref:uncharacterized protein n=1 Tax=Leptinotarsa decemlineata TaxID=7539 RepID=UPI000C2558B9|nr:uncharacterized protein LOC111508620 [Leptinotarsa decemlineata]